MALQNPLVTFASFYFADWCEGETGGAQESSSHKCSGDSGIFVIFVSVNAELNVTEICVFFVQTL